jgi:SAM-dependent methyltransferase
MRHEGASLMDYTKLNADAWDKHVEDGYEWTKPISHERYAEACGGTMKVYLTPTIPTPLSWFPKITAETKILGLASGGGQQGPIFQALGADVTIMDFSDRQLEMERFVADREAYSISIIKADMTEKFPFANESFDLIFHPISNCYVKEIQGIWDECFRVLKKGGFLLSGFVKEEHFLFDPDFQNEDVLISRHSLPYDSLRDFSGDELKNKIQKRETLVFSHTLTEQMGGQIRAGFAIHDLYEDGDGGGLFDKYMNSYVATKAMKPWISEDLCAHNR